MWSCISGLFNCFCGVFCRVHPLHGQGHDPWCYRCHWPRLWLPVTLNWGHAWETCPLALSSAGFILSTCNCVILFQILYLSLKGNKHMSVYYAVYNMLKMTFNVCVWILEALTWTFSRTVVKCMTGTTDEVILRRTLTFDPRHTQTRCAESFSLNKHFIFHS